MQTPEYMHQIPEINGLLLDQLKQAFIRIQIVSIVQC